MLLISIWINFETYLGKKFRLNPTLQLFINAIPMLIFSKHIILDRLYTVKFVMKDNPGFFDKKGGGIKQKEREVVMK